MRRPGSANTIPLVRKRSPIRRSFIAHAAAFTCHIKLGTGVISLPYHNPLWVADKMLFLDHLTCGVGPCWGSVPAHSLPTWA